MLLLGALPSYTALPGHQPAVGPPEEREHTICVQTTLHLHSGAHHRCICRVELIMITSSCCQSRVSNALAALLAVCTQALRLWHAGDAQGVQDPP